MEFHKQNTIRITCAPKQVPYLQQEVEDLDYEVDAIQPASLEIKATLNDAMFLNLHLRTASSILYLIQEFRCRSPEELYKNTTSHDWENIISPDEYLSVVSKVNTPTIDNWMYAGMKVKDAIVDRLQNKLGRRPDSGAQRDNLVINLYWMKDRCWLYLNTSGNKLADRNYRKMPHRAPMQEALAAAVLLATGYDGQQPLVTPMCGSGTLAIEAALIATKRPPGLLRDNFGFMHSVGFDDQTWQAIRREARKYKSSQAPPRIIATDIDPQAIRAAQKNALTAGVERLIDFKVCDFAETPIPPEPGIVLLNPEYGERLGDVKELEETYSRIGDFFKQKCPGHTGYIFTGNLELAKKVGLRASRRIEFFNAKIECRLLKYELYTGSKEK